MMEESDEGYDEKHAEDGIKKIIRKIKENRNSPCCQNILNFAKRQGMIMGITKLKEIVSKLIDCGVIGDKGSGGGGR